MVNEEQLFRELDYIKTAGDKTLKLVELQNSRVRKLEQRVFVQWFLWGGIGATLLVILPIVIAHVWGGK